MRDRLLQLGFKEDTNFFGETEYVDKTGQVVITKIDKTTWRAHVDNKSFETIGGLVFKNVGDLLEFLYILGFKFEEITEEFLIDSGFKKTGDNKYKLDEIEIKSGESNRDGCNWSVSIFKDELYVCDADIQYTIELDRLISIYQEL